MMEGSGAGSVLWLTSPDLGGPKTYGSGSTKLLKNLETVCAALTLENPNTVGQLLVSEMVLCCAERLAEDLEGPQHHAGRVPAVGPHYEAAAPACNL
jgi:hypothetical protein